VTRRPGDRRMHLGVCERAIALHVQGRPFRGTVDQLAARINHPVNRTWIALASGPGKNLFHAVVVTGGLIQVTSVKGH
jgi:hypothetical protein